MLTRTGLLSLAALVAGCASAPPEAGPAGPFSWNTRPDPAEVLALKTRITPFLAPDGEACLSALLLQRADTAAALVLAEPNPGIQEQLLRAFPEPVQLEQLRAGEEALARATEASEAGSEIAIPVQLPTRSMQARAGYLALGAAWRADGITPQLVEHALALAPYDWTVTQALEAMRATGAFALPPARERTWRRGVAQLALERGRPLVALQQATAARELSRAPAEAAEDGVLLARIQRGLQHGDAALLEARQGLKLAGTPALRQELEAQAGWALILLGQPQDAAEAFGRSEQAAAEAGKDTDALRQAVNRCSAWLKTGEPDLARQVAAELQGGKIEPTGPDAPEIVARRTIVASMALLLTGELDAFAAAQRVEVALGRARSAGAVSVVETWASLPDRLRAGRN